MRPPRVVELVRVSSSDQHERDTAQAQRRALDALRERRPAEVIARIDPPHAVSASAPVSERPDLAELAVLAATGFEELRCFDLTRLSRAESPVDRMMVLSLVAGAGAIIVDCSGRELDPRRDEDELAYYVQTLFGRAERRKFVQRTAAGKAARAERKQIVNPGHTPFGYRAEPRPNRGAPYTIVADPETAPVVADIYRRVLAGEGTDRIAAALMEAGVPAPMGGRKWQGGSVARMVRRETYAGVYLQRIQGVTYRVPCPALVSRDTWEAAQTALTRRHHTQGRPGTVPALCRMRIWCGACGERMTVRLQSAGRGKPRYMCATQKKGKREVPHCGAPTHLVSDIDAAVWAELRAIIENPALLSEAMEGDADRGEAWAEQLAQCEATITKARRDERRVLDLLRRDLLSEDAAAEELRRIRSATQTAERSAEVARRGLQAAARDHVDLDAIEVFRPLLDAASFEEQRRILEALIPEDREHGVFVHGDGTVHVVGIVAAAAAEPAYTEALPCRSVAQDFGVPAKAAETLVFLRRLRVPVRARA